MRLAAEIALGVGAAAAITGMLYLIYRKNYVLYEAEQEPDPTYQCPKCGMSDELYVTQCMVYGDMKLHDDGFVISGSSEQERVRCDNCGHESIMDDFYYTPPDEKEPDIPPVATDVEASDLLFSS